MAAKCTETVSQENKNHESFRRHLCSKPNVETFLLFLYNINKVHDHERICCVTYNDTVQFLYNTPHYNMDLDTICPNVLTWNM